LFFVRILINILFQKSLCLKLQAISHVILQKVEFHPVILNPSLMFFECWRIIFLGVRREIIVKDAHLRKILELSLLIALAFLAISIDERAVLLGEISLDGAKETIWGQPAPGSEPVLFAPEVFTAELGAHGRLSFSPEGREILFSSHEKIYYAAFDGKSLSPAKVAPFVDSSRHNGPVFSPDGRTVYFTSMRGLPNEKDTPNGRIWGVERGVSGWGEPYLLSEKIERITAQISLTNNGHLYFTRLVDRERSYFYSKLEDRRLSDPERVSFSGWRGIQLNDLYVDPQERYLIGSVARSDRELFRIADLVISFRQADGAWGELQLLNDKINTDRFERFPGLSPDGRFLFYARSSEAGSYKGARYYWVAAETLGISGFSPLFTIFQAKACVSLSGCIPYSLPGYPAILFPHL
jgi:hypothetical protein